MGQDLERLGRIELREEEGKETPEPVGPDAEEDAAAHAAQPDRRLPSDR